MTVKGWARVRQSGVHGLRRGAWYAVVSNGAVELLVLDVNKRTVPVPRSLVEMVDDRPTQWSVVRWDPSDRGVSRVAEVGFDRTYAVCPGCRARVRFEPARPARMICPECAGEYDMNWQDFC